MTNPSPPGSPIDLAIRAAGSISALAQSLGLSQQAISKWKANNKIPLDRVLDVSRVTGLPTRLLVPENFANAMRER